MLLLLGLQMVLHSVNAFVVDKMRNRVRFVAWCAVRPKLAHGEGQFGCAKNIGVGREQHL